MDHATEDFQPDQSAPPPKIPASALPNSVKVSVVGIFLLSVIGALYFARGFMLPVAVASLFALALGPVVRSLERRGVPPPFTAVATVATLFVLVAAATYSLSGPVSHWLDAAPQLGAQIHRKVQVLLEPVKAVQEASEQVDQLAKTQADPTVQRVVIQEPGLLSRAAAGAPEIVAQVGLTLVLLLFLLASGDLFYEKLVHTLPTLSDKKRAVRIARDIERDVSRYLLTITFINAAFGLWIGFGLFLIGVPNPLLWGVVAFFLNFIQFIGAVVGTILVAVVALVSFDNLFYAFLPPAFYVFTTTVEGQFLTPMIIGRRLEMNIVVVFLAVAFWAWLWGIVGAIIAVPMLVVLKVLSERVEGLGAIGEFLSERRLRSEEDAEESQPVSTDVSSRAPHSTQEPS